MRGAPRPGIAALALLSPGVRLSALTTYDPRIMQVSAKLSF